MFSFWLEYNCPLLKSKEIREVEAKVEFWKRNVAVLGRAGQCRDAQDGRDLSGYSCGALGLVLCHGSLGRGSLGVNTWKRSTGGSWAVVHASLGLCGV